MRKLLLAGFSMEARVLAEELGDQVVAVTGNDGVGGTWRGLVRHAGDVEAIAAGGFDAVLVAIDDGQRRQRVQREFARRGCAIASLIGGRVAPSSECGDGLFMQRDTSVSTDCRLGNGVRMNTGSVVMHDCEVGDFTTLAPRSVLLGRVRIGSRVYVGSNATILPDVTVGSDAMIGAGAVVTKTVPRGATVKGVPARESRPDRRMEHGFSGIPAELRMKAAGAHWWARPRRITILNDTIGWMTPWCRALHDRIVARGDSCQVIHSSKELVEGDIAFFLGCTRLIGAPLLALNRHNLVVHASALPKGRGFSPLKWLISGGANRIPLTLFEAVVATDAGDIYGTTEIEFEGHELLDEMQSALGAASNDLCMRYLDSPVEPAAMAQQGEPTYFGRRTEDHQRLDPDRAIREQFATLRTIDNTRFPGLLGIDGVEYEIRISKRKKPGT